VASDDAATVPTKGLALPTLVAPRFALRVVAGPDAGALFRFDAVTASRVLIGQSPACEVRLRDPQVSRRHASIDPADRGLRLTDLGSTNGTFVGDLLVVDAFLRGGEALRVGGTVLAVELTSAATEAPLDKSVRFGRLVGASPAMRRLYPLVARIAQSHVPVVIEGETGTGKELLAETLHENGARADGPFVIFDCTAVPPSLLESALFGHERGAFTGAVSARRGVFEQADGGTLLIDEIGDLDVALQSKLLRAIERGEVQRVGSEKWIRVDVRIVAATRRDLDRAVQAGRFRDDLYFRLAVARIELPPLRERHGDIALLARHFWKSLDGDGPLPEDLLSRFDGYAWPGNVRELHNVVSGRIALGDLAPAGAPAPTAVEDADVLGRVLGLDLPLARARQQVIDAFDRLYVERVLARHGGNVTRAAAASGIGRRYLQVLRSKQGGK
jgi:transcriptional regulator with GAF, ATPase, and Fis domain